MKNCIKCGSHAFNLYAEGIDQGDLCDVHYWQGRAHRAEAQPAQEPFGYVSIGNTPIFQKETPEIGRWETVYTTPQQPEQKPMHPQIQKMYEDYFDKCFKESSALDAAVLAEREACAEVCESRMTPGTGSVAILNGAAAAIRARGNT
jgi:hypothetical protein